MAEPIEVKCRLEDCIHYTPHPRDSGMCLCTHVDKGNYMDNVNCPLYRADWQKALKAGKRPT